MSTAGSVLLLEVAGLEPFLPFFIFLFFDFLDAILANSSVISCCRAGKDKLFLVVGRDQ